MQTTRLEENRPTVQPTQDAMAGEPATVPSAQAAHVLAAVALVDADALPAAQSVHLAIPVAAPYVPGAHGVHPADCEPAPPLPCPCCPTGQSMQLFAVLELITVENVFTGQAMQVDEACDIAYVPATQA